jgi:hypothetical protein
MGLSRMADLKRAFETPKFIRDGCNTGKGGVKRTEEPDMACDARFEEIVERVSSQGFN